MVTGEWVSRIKVVNIDNVVQVGAASVVTHVRAIRFVDWGKFGSWKFTIFSFTLQSIFSLCCRKIYLLINLTIAQDISRGKLPAKESDPQASDNNYTWECSLCFSIKPHCVWARQLQTMFTATLLVPHSGFGPSRLIQHMRSLPRSPNMKISISVPLKLAVAHLTLPVLWACICVSITPVL